MSSGEEENELLNLDIEISEESESDSDSFFDSDDDDEGEIGEEVRQVDDHPDDVGRMPRPYQHEPEPQQLPGPGEEDQGVAGAGLNYGVGFRGNRDASRLDPRNTDNWCQCGRCGIHQSFQVNDCVCCREIVEVVSEADASGVQCITEARDFDAAVLNPTTLAIAWQHFTERWRKQARGFGARNNEKYRYVAYRQFVRWCWGILGKDIRVQLPACVQVKIKDTYPDGRNVYKGTLLRRLEL